MSQYLQKSVIVETKLMGVGASMTPGITSPY